MSKDNLVYFPTEIDKEKIEESFIEDLVDPIGMIFYSMMYSNYYSQPPERPKLSLVKNEEEDK